MCMVSLNDCGMSDICKNEEIVIADTCAFTFDRNEPHALIFSNHALKEVNYLSRLIELARTTDSFYVPNTVLSEIHRGINLVDGGEDLTKATANFRRELRELGRVIYPKEHLDQYKELKKKLLPLKDTFGLSSVDLDVLVCSVELSATVRTGIVTDDKYIIYAYLMMQNRPEISVYSRLWTNGSNTFERLDAEQMSGLRSKAYDNIHSTKEK